MARRFDKSPEGILLHALGWSPGCPAFSDREAKTCGIESGILFEDGSVDCNATENGGISCEVRARLYHQPPAGMNRIPNLLEWTTDTKLRKTDRTVLPDSS